MLYRRCLQSKRIERQKWFEAPGYLILKINFFIVSALIHNSWWSANPDSIDAII